MRRIDIYSSGWLKAPDMLAAGETQGLDLTIKAISTSQMDNGDEQRSLTFVEDERKLGLNATNWDSIAAITGKDDDDGWVGTVINVYPHKLDRPYNGKTHGIRVQIPQGVGPAKGPAKTPPARANAADGARKHAFEAMKLTLAPDATREEIGAAWLKAVSAMFPGKQQVELTAAQWTQLQSSFSTYQGEPEAKGIDSSDIPF